MKKTILLVDDEKDIREVLSISLADIGYEVYTAENGEKALRVFQKFKPAIVLIDIKIPGMDGIETLEKMKKLFPLTEVVMLTGHATVESAIEGIKKGAYDYLMKPCDIDQLMQKVEEATQKKGVHEDKIREAKVKEAMSMHGLE